MINPFLVSLINVRIVRKYTILIALIMLSNSVRIYGQLSDQSKISILTCAPGDELYSIFGHTAIRVNDPVNKFDIVFNYGTFDFDTPNFYLKFLRGELNYMLSVSTYERFLFEYQYFKRSVWEQVLILDETEKNNLYKALVVNAEPENRFYHYHFFFDNCATRIRDMIVNNVGDSVVFNIFPVAPKTTMTYREAIATYLYKSPWTELGLDIILGRPTDDYVNGETIQFLPDYLMSQFEGSKRKDDGSLIVAPTTTILEFSDQMINSSIKPGYCLWIIAMFIFLISWIGTRKNKNTRWLDIILFSATGLIGVLITFLWFFTEHSVTAQNWHILWANPLYLLIIFCNFNKKLSLLFNTIIIIVFAAVIFTILFFYLFPQDMPSELIPVWVVLGLRLALPLFVKGNSK